MNIAKFAIRKPVTVFITVVVVFIIGLFALFLIPIEMYPDIKVPVLLISTTYTGAQPQQVEERVTRPLESMLMNVSGLKEITSTSSKGNSIIILEFDWNEDLNEASNEARDKIESIKRMLPEECETPVIYKFDTTMIPIMQLQISGNMDSDELYRMAEKNIKPLFEQIPGVATASLSGGVEQIVEISASQNRLDALGLTLSNVASLLGTQNVDAGGGDIKEGEKVYSIKTSGEFSSLEQIQETVLTVTSSGRSIQVQDIGEVRWSHKDRTNHVFVNHKEGLMLSIQRQSGGNSVQVADKVIASLQKINQMFPSVQIDLLYDSTEIIRTILKQVLSSLIQGALLAVLVIFLFMRDIRSMIIIGISIPFSVLLTLTAMYFTGFTLNLFTLTGLILGLGMVVDASIVVLENIFRYREKGTKLESSAVLGSGEMTGAITGSTLTTVCVFVPMILFSGKLDMIGLFLKPLAFTIVFALMASLAVAVTLVPLMASKFPRIYTKKQRPILFKPLTWFDSLMERFLTGLENLYRKVLKVFVCKGKKSVLAGILFTLLLVVLIIITSGMMFSKGLNLAPQGKDDSVTLNIKLPKGTRLEITTDVILSIQDRLEAALIKKDETGAIIEKPYRHIIASAGGGTFAMMGASSEHAGSLAIYLEKEVSKEHSAPAIMGILRGFFADYPGVEFSFSNGGNSMSSGMPFDLKVMGLDLEKVMETTYQIRQMVIDECDFVLEPNVDFDDGLPQLLIQIDRQKAYEKGINMYGIGKEVLANIKGIQASMYRVEGDEYEIYVRLREEDRSQVIDLDRISLPSMKGKRIPLSSLAQVKVVSGPVSIKRENQQRLCHLQGRLADGISSTEATSRVLKKINENLVLENGIVVLAAGEVEDMQQMKKYVVFMLLFAVLLVFAVMAGIFESLLDPFIIFLTLFTLPIGVGLIYFITSTQMSMFSVIGMILLVGIIVNNGIVLVDYINLLRHREVEIHQAVLEAGVSRLRPVLMTSLTTILGMVPMAFFSDENSVQPIGVTVIGGMSVSTLLTLLIVPIDYLAFDFFKNINRRIKRRIGGFFYQIFLKWGWVKRIEKEFDSESLDYGAVLSDLPDRYSLQKEKNRKNQKEK